MKFSGGLMEFTIKEITDKKEKEIISRDILNDLPEWFGMPESTEEYIKDSQDKPFLACFIDMLQARTVQIFL